MLSIVCFHAGKKPSYLVAFIAFLIARLPIIVVVILREGKIGEERLTLLVMLLVLGSNPASSLKILLLYPDAKKLPVTLREHTALIT